MEEYHFDARVSNSRSICVGAITRREAATSGAEFCDGLGYYLYVTNPDDPEATEVLARFASEEAALRMSAMLKRLSIG